MKYTGNRLPLSSKSGREVKVNKVKARTTASSGVNKTPNKSSVSKGQQKQHNENKTHKNNKRPRSQDEDEEEEEQGETTADDLENQSVKRKKTKGSSNNSSWSQIEAWIDATDVLLMVLDARDPQRCKSKRLERLVRQHADKRIVYVLNKIGNVQKGIDPEWARNQDKQQQHLTSKTHTLFFRCTVI